jgi:hypothetical protein
MEGKKILGGVLIFILLIILFNSIKNSYTTTTTTKVVRTNTNISNNPNVYKVNHNPNYNPYKAHYYN